MGEAHLHSDVELNLITEGSCRYFVGGQFETVMAGDIVLFWAGIPHQTVHRSPDAAGIWATLPLDWLLRWQGTARMAEKLLRGDALKTSARAPDQAILAGWVDDLASANPDLERIAALEMEAWLSRLALRLQYPKPRKTAPGTPERMTLVTDFLSVHYTEDIGVNDVAKAVGLHPKYLLTLFRKHCHLSLWEYVLRLRLAHAQRLLLMTDRTVTDIAMEAGFGSVSSFYSAFRRYIPDAVPKAFRTSEGMFPKRERVKSP